MEGICWNIENDGPQSPDLNPIEQIWGKLQNKLDRSIVNSKESSQEVYWHCVREMLLL